MGRERLKITASYLNLLLCVLGIFFSSCLSTSNQALPQASLPIPSNDGSEGIEIAAPNSAGFVVITAPADTVPDNATVVVSVGSSTSFLINWAKYRYAQVCDLLIPSAQASSTSCTLDIPECPSLSSEGECQDTAAEDGSFSLQVEADDDDRITVSYINPTSCEEVIIIEEQEPNDDTIDLGINAVSFVTDPILGISYILGSDEEGNNTIVTVDVGNREILDTQTVSATGTPENLKVFFDHNSSAYFVMETSRFISVGPVPTDGTIDESTLVEILDPDGNALFNASYLTALSFDRSASSATCPNSSLFSEEEQMSGTGLYTRLYFANSGSSSATLYFYDYLNAPDDVDPTFASTGSSGISQVRVSELEILFPDMSDYLITSIRHLGGHGYTDSSLFMLLSVLDRTSSETKYYVIKTDSVDAYDFCNGSISIPPEKRLDLGLLSDDLDSKEILNLFNEDENDYQDFLTILDRENQELVFVNLDDLAIEATVSFLPDEGTYSFEDRDGASESGNYAFTGDVELFLPIQRDDSELEIFFTGSDFTGSDFFGPEITGPSILEPESSTLYTLSPIQAEHDSSNNQLIVLDRGLLGDRETFEFDAEIGLHSFLKFFELAEAE